MCLLLPLLQYNYCTLPCKPFFLGGGRIDFAHVPFPPPPPLLFFLFSTQPPPPPLPHPTHSRGEREEEGWLVWWCREEREKPSSSTSSFQHRRRRGVEGRRAFPDEYIDVTSTSLPSLTFSYPSASGHPPSPLLLLLAPEGP